MSVFHAGSKMRLQVNVVTQFTDFCVRIIQQQL